MCSALLTLSVGFGVLHAAAETYRIAILDEPSLPIEGQATPVAAIDEALAEEGVEIARLNADRLADAQCFNADAFDLLVVPTGASFPAMAQEALLAFLQKGGDLLCTGGYAFDRLWIRKDGTWISPQEHWAQEELKARDPKCSLIANGGFENASDGWHAANPAECTVVEQGASSGHACGQAANSVIEGGNCWETVLPVQPGQRYLVGAQMKADKIQGAGFAYLAVYQHDAQGGLVQFVDFVQLRQSSDWARYETQVDVAPNAARVVFKGGLYRATGTVWLDDVTCAALPKQGFINAHYGKPEDGLTLETLQLTLFSPDQPLGGDILTISPDASVPGLVFTGTRERI